MTVRRQVLYSDGALGVKLLARPWSNAYYTITAWRDEPSVRRFVGSSPHREIMARFPEVALVTESVFCSWTATADTLPPKWRSAFAHLAEAAGERDSAAASG